MDISKVKAALALAKTELRNAITSEAKVMSDPKADVAAVAGASKALNVAGRIDAALAKAESRIVSALKKLEPRVKKDKKKKAA